MIFIIIYSCLLHELTRISCHFSTRVNSHERYIVVIYCDLGIQTSQENTSLPPAEPPPPISLEELQGEARTVASKVLSRPQSGMVFMEDIKAAIAMWADRLTNLLGPPRQGI